MKCPEKLPGCIAIVGRTNVGKSSLFNQWAPKSFFSAASSKRHTTRSTVQAEFEISGIPCKLLDSPGLGGRSAGSSKVPLRAFEQVNAAHLALAEVWVFVSEAHRWTVEDEKILNQLSQLQKQQIRPVPLIWVINKVDRLRCKSQLLGYIQAIHERFPGTFSEVFPLSAYSTQDVEGLNRLVLQWLPKLTNASILEEGSPKPEPFVEVSPPLLQEVIKSQIYRFCHQEIPYQCEVQIEACQPDPEGKSLEVSALIQVERPSQRNLILGQGHKKLKSIQDGAQCILEKRLGQKVALRLWAKTRRTR